MTVETTPATERAAEQMVRAESVRADDTTEVRVHEDHTRETRTPGFTRMRTDWHGPDAVHVQSLHHIVDGRILHLFPEAFMLMNDLYDIVRQPACDAAGEVLTDAHGFSVWARNESGAFVEDYSRLDIRQREDFLFRITTNIFEWRQTAASMWGDAMFAKAQWEEAMASGFLSPVTGKNTDEARTHRARQHATDERYFAIFQGLLSRKADAIVGSVELLGQRLKDVLS